VEALIIIGFFALVAIAVLASFALFGGLIFWVVKRASWSADRLVKIGQTLGLAAEGNRRLAGLRNGVHVCVRHVTEGSGDNKSSWTYAEAEIDPPLRLGLNLRRKGWLGTAWSELFGASGIAVGDPAFDADFTINAIEAGDVPRLFDADLKAALVHAHGTLQRLWITDDKVHASFSGFSTDQTKITLYLDSVIRLAQIAQVSRRRMGPTAREREVQSAWGAIAQMSGWRFDPETLVLEGESGRHRFTVVPTLGKSGWSTRFRVSFDRGLGVALILRKEFALAAVGRLFGMTDIEVGEARFDSAFRVKGSDPDAVKHILGDTKVRESLLHLLSAARKLEVHDDCIDATAQGLISDQAALSHSLSLVVEVAEGLRSRIDAPRVGAYR